jgi:hypothetical protein
MIQDSILVCSPDLRILHTARRRQAERYVQHSLPKMDGIHANEEQRPRKVWIADDRTDNAVLHGRKHVPRNVVKAIDILTNHRFDKKEPKNNNNNQRNKNWNDDDTESTITTQSSFNQEEAKNAHNATVVAREDTMQTNVLKKEKDPRTNGQ